MHDEFAAPPVRRTVTPWPYSWAMMSFEKSPSRPGVVCVQRYICIRLDVPSADREKLALLVPEPSCASAKMGSPPRPPRP